MNVENPKLLFLLKTHFFYITIPQICHALKSIQSSGVYKFELKKGNTTVQTGVLTNNGITSIVTNGEGEYILYVTDPSNVNCPMKIRFAMKCCNSGGEPPLVEALVKPFKSAATDAGKGSIYITYSEPSGEVNYIWSKKGDPSFLRTTKNIDKLAVGEYCVRIISSNCHYTDAEVCFTIVNETDCVKPKFALSSTSSCDCSSCGEGTITVSPNILGSEFSFFWSNGSTTQNLINLRPGTYTLNLKSKKTGCEHKFSTVVDAKKTTVTIGGNCTKTITCDGKVFTTPGIVVQLEPTSGSLCEYRAKCADGLVSDIQVLTPSFEKDLDGSCTECRLKCTCPAPMNNSFPYVGKRKDVLVNPANCTYLPGCEYDNNVPSSFNGECKKSPGDPLVAEFTKTEFCYYSQIRWVDCNTTLPVTAYDCWKFSTCNGSIIDQNKDGKINTLDASLHDDFVKCDFNTLSPQCVIPKNLCYKTIAFNGKEHCMGFELGTDGKIIDQDLNDVRGNICDSDREATINVNGTEVPANCDDINRPEVTNHICPSGLFASNAFDNLQVLILGKNLMQSSQQRNLVRLFPNPFENSLNVSIFSKSKQNANISVYDVLGRMVYKSESEVYTGDNTNTIDIALNVELAILTIVVKLEDGFVHTEKVVYRK